MSGLTLRGVSKSFGDTAVVTGFDLSVDDGECVVLLGPSGCGKTTCLRMIAGFERPDAGTIHLGDRTLSDDRAFVPPDKRGISVVFQSYALWPHMDVGANVGYGLRMARVPKPEIRRRVEDILERVNLPGMRSRYIHQLSGGQQQRVALARALVTHPSVLLLDEPLSNLDSHLREEMRIELHRIQRSMGVTMLYVTHDQAEALSLADRLVVMNQGRIEQIGTPEDIYRAPATAYVAKSLGTTNIIPAEAGPGGRLALFPGLVLDLPERPGRTGAVEVCVRPADIRVARASSVVHGQVDEVLFFGDHMSYVIRPTGSDATVKAVGTPHDRCEIGDKVALTIDPRAIAVLGEPQSPPAPAGPAR